MSKAKSSRVRGIVAIIAEGRLTRFTASPLSTLSHEGRGEKTQLIHQHRAVAANARHPDVRLPETDAQCLEHARQQSID